MEGAATKLGKAEAGAEKLRPIVDAESTLRTSGSFSSSLEEVRWILGRWSAIPLYTIAVYWW